MTGVCRFRTITESYYRGAHGILLVYSVTDQESFDNVGRWISEIERVASEDVHMMLIGNNCDRTLDRVVTTEMGLALANQHRLSFMETSARDDVNVQKAFELMTDGIMDNMDGGKRRRERLRLQRHKLGRVQLTWLLCRHYTALDGRGCPEDKLVQLLQDLPFQLFVSIIESLDVTMIHIPDHELGPSAAEQDHADDGPGCRSRCQLQ